MLLDPKKKFTARPSACIMAGIVLLLPLVFSRWSAPAIIYDFFFIFAKEHGWGVVAVTAAGGAGSADIDKLSREGWKNIYNNIYQLLYIRDCGGVCTGRKTFGVYIVLKVGSDVQGLRTHTHTHTHGAWGALVPCGHASTERNCIACSRGLKHKIPASRRLSIYTYHFLRLFWSDPITYVVYVYLYNIYSVMAWLGTM